MKTDTSNANAEVSKVFKVSVVLSKKTYHIQMLGLFSCSERTRKNSFRSGFCIVNSVIENCFYKITSLHWVVGYLKQSYSHWILTQSMLFL